MKILLIILFTVFSLVGESTETCYTVQLTSAYNSKKNFDIINKKMYPESCQIMEIGKHLTVRCGCYQKNDDVQKALKKLQNRYEKASIASTYAYRFNKAQIDSKKEKVHVENKLQIVTKPEKENVNINSKDDEELRLILQVYLYKGDIDSAYKVASRGYEKYPNSYYWNEKMAEVSRWTNRPVKSIKHLRTMYDMKYSKKIEDELITYGSSAYQYEDIEDLVVSRASHNPTEENIDHMILIYKKIGSPEKVIAVLYEQYKKNPDNTMLLTKGLELSLELADLDLAKDFVEKIQKNKPYKKIDAVLITKYYYVQQEIDIAYENLSYVDKSDNIDNDYNIKYFELKSDLGWYLQDNVNAAEASKSLMERNKARLADYERISFVYKNSDPKISAYAMQRGYSEYKMPYLFYSYANLAINNKNFEGLNEYIQTIDETTSPLVNDSFYWIIKSNIYGYYKEEDLEKSALQKALALSPENYEIRLTLLYYFMKVGDTAEVENILTQMADSEDLNYGYYFPMASAYFYLSDINRASYYMQELYHMDSDITKLIDFKFLQAYIYQVQNNEYAFKSTMKSIIKDLKLEAKKNPKLKKENEYLSNYLRAAMPVINPDKFEKKLKSAKAYLSKKNYDEISYSWAVKNAAYEKSLNIYQKMDPKELWIQFNNAILFQNHDTIENLLEKYLLSTSMGDASQAIEKDGQISLAQSFTYDGFSKNDNNQNAYIHHRDMSKVRSDYLDVKTSYYNRKPLLQKYIRVENKTYIDNQLYLNANFDYYKNETLDKRLLRSVPDDTIETGIGIERVSDRGMIGAHFDYYNSMEDYFGGSLYTKYRLSTDLHIDAKVAINETALESTQLLLGGKKDMLSLNMSWDILNSTSLNLLYERNYYTSQDEVDLGDGDYSRLSLIHQIRTGYPDIRIGAFIDYGVYDETSGSRGVIDKIQAQDFPVLPQDFYNLGVSVSYGMANASDYTRAWRPYVEFYPYYNSDQDAYTFGLNIGYGGKIWHQDHLIFGASYSEPVSGQGDRIIELFLDYHFMYRHP